MAFLGEDFNVDDLPQGNSDGDFKPVPEGWYTAKIAQADLKPTKDGTGQLIKVRYDILGPTHQGRVLFGNLNLRNKSPQAEEIGRQQMGDICRSIGITRIQDTDQLIGGELSIKVVIKPASGQYPEGNEIKAFKAISGSSAPAPAATSAPAATGSAPPWARK